MRFEGDLSNLDDRARTDFKEAVIAGLGLSNEAESAIVARVELSAGSIIADVFFKDNEAARREQQRALEKAMRGEVYVRFQGKSMQGSAVTSPSPRAPKAGAVTTDGGD